MHEAAVRQLLEDVRRGAIPVETALGRLRALPFEDLGFAKVDHHRAIRCGFPEVIFGTGKSPAQISRIFRACAERGANVLATRVSADAAAAVRREHADAVHDEVSRTIVLRQIPAKPVHRTVAIVSAGTSDMPVAEEARVTAEIMDQPCATYYDVGVAGIHRVLAHGEAIQSASVVVVVAGMEGALASVVGGLVSAPVIAVPTSIGYGASFQGLAALLAMLNSCAAGVSVVNIDNGFGAGYIAALINRRAGGNAAPDTSV